MFGIVVVFPVRRLHFLQAIFLLLFGVGSCQARRNTTLDSSSPLIRYSPISSWREVSGSLDAGGEHMMTQDPNAYALINFTFVSYWIMSAKWPYRVTTQHTIDGNRTLLLDLQDHAVPNIGGGSASKSSSIVAQYPGSSELAHSIRISIPSGDQYAVVDRLIFEVEDNSSSTPSSFSTRIPTLTQKSVSIQTTLSVSIATSSSASSLSPGELSSIDKARKLTIILGTLGPFLALFFVLLFVYLYYRRRITTKRLEVDNPTIEGRHGLNNKLTSSLSPSSATTHSEIPGRYLFYTRQGFKESLDKAIPISPSTPFSPNQIPRMTHTPQPF